MDEVHETGLVQDEEMNDPGLEQEPNVTSSSAPMETDDDEINVTQKATIPVTTTAAADSSSAGEEATQISTAASGDAASNNVKSEATKLLSQADLKSTDSEDNMSGIDTPLSAEKGNNEITKAEPVQPKPPAPEFADPEDAKWHTVGIFQNLSATVTSYIDNRSWTSSGMELTSDQLPDLTKYQRINLEPGTAYRFRLRAINSVGASEWSEISSFKTCLPGFPGAPSAIKISKSSEGAHLTWEPPPTCQSSNEIVEYSVYLAVKPAKEKEKTSSASPQRLPAQLAFVRVYVGAANQCTVSHTSLAAAHVDCSNKPAIIFRIAARNEKGYGPATQVRWLQDPVQSGTGGSGASSLLSPPRIKSELGGASPSKRFKAGTGGTGALTKMPPPSAGTSDN